MAFYSASATWMVNFAFVWALLAQNAPETGARSVKEDTSWPVFTERKAIVQKFKKRENMLNKTVLVDLPIHTTALNFLKEKVQHVLTPYTAPPEEIRALLPQVHSVILGSALTFGGAEMDLAEKLEVIGRYGVGLDNVDVPAASERGLPLVFTPYGPTESTAEHAFLLIQATARRLPLVDRAVRSGDFGISQQLQARGYELDGKALGVVGFGRIGRRVAEMCRDALHMQVYVFDPFLNAETVSAWGATYVQDLIELAGQVDILSIHAPFTPETHHLIDEKVIRALKPGAILVNTSRGGLIDEPALIEALQEGHLGGVGLDVYDPEPPAPDNPLLQLDHAVLTPHVGSFTDEGRQRMGLMVVEDTLSVLRGEKPQYLANPQVWAHRRIP
jgi:D-3-phosphoglycerate dehydrogenase